MNDIQIFNVKSNLNAKAAISLTHLGISTTVLTTIGEIEEMIEEFESQPDGNWCNGLGKEFLYKMLLRKLREKDVYFTNNPKKVTPSNQKWRDFCNDCFTLFVLDSVRNGNVIKLVHPDQYRERLKETIFDGTTGDLPDYIEGIPTIQ